jgi:hypothetical protein
VVLLAAFNTTLARLDCESVVPSICALNGAGVHCHPCSNAAFVVCSGPRAPGEVQACEPGHHWHAFYARCQPHSSEQQQQQQQQQQHEQQPEARCRAGVNLQVPGAFLLEQRQQQQDVELMAPSSTTSSSWSGWVPLVGAFASKQQRTARVNLRLHMVRNPDSSSSAMNAAAVGVSPAQVGQGTGEQLPAARTGAASNDPTAGVVAELLAVEAAARQLGGGAAAGASQTGDGITAAYVHSGLEDESFELFVDFSEEDATAGGAVAAAAAQPRLAHPAEALTLPGSSSSSHHASSGLAQAEVNPFGEGAAARAEAAADENSNSSSAVADAPMDVVQRFIEEQVVTATPDAAKEDSSSTSSSVVNDSQWRRGVEEFDAELVAQLNSALLDIDARGQ